MKASRLTADYVQDLSYKSNAGYLMRYDEKTKTYNIGNKVIVLDKNNLIIGDKVYNATKGLMELLLKNHQILV